MIISENFPYTHEFFKIFDEICKIPHGSGNTQAIADYCIEFAKECGCDAVQDNAGNVIIKKVGGVGFETSEPIIIQGHLDMVCDKTPDSNHDFTRDPLKLSFDGKYITAENTTLGGDDGIAIAYGLALIKDKELQLPPLEILLTVDEETGLFGAADLDGSLLSGKNLINLDSEEEGTLLCGCAGGITASVTQKFKETFSVGTCVTLSLTGLAGGHSGVEIHKRRLNAAKVMASLLSEVAGQIRLVSLVSGSKNNAIPCNAVAKFVVCKKDIDVILEKINTIFSSLEVISTEDTPKLNIDKKRYFGKALTVKDTKSIIDYLNDVPDGVLEEGKTGVITSLNTGISTYSNGNLYCESLIRSMDNSQLKKVSDEVSATAYNYGFAVNYGEPYPAWEYNEVSPLREKMVEVFEKMYGSKPQVATIHAGLECGLISEKIPGMDAVSLGPDILDVHTVNEKLDVESSIRVWEYLVELLKSF